MFKAIYIVDDYPLLSQTFVTRQVEFLVKKGVHVTVLTSTNSLIELSNEVSVRRLRKFTFLKAFKNFMKLPRKLDFIYFIFKALFKRNISLLKNSFRYVLGREHPLIADVAVCHFLNNGVYGELLRNHGLLKVDRCVTIAHGYELTVKKMLARWAPFYTNLFKITDDILPVSQLWKNRLEQMGCSPSKLSVQRMGVSCKFSDPLNEPYHIGDVLRIITVGRATEKKGIEYAIRAVAKLTNVKYSIIGGGVLEPILRDLIIQLEVSDRIEYLGACSHEEVLTRLRHQHVFLLPSITAGDGDMEGVPVALMESMASGLLAVSTFHSGIPELIEHKVSGLLCQERSIDDIVENLRLIQEGRIDFEAMQRSAREKIIKDFNSDLLDDAFYAYISRK